MNLSQLKDQVYLFLGERSGGFYQDSEIVTAINNAMLYIADLTGALEQLATRNTTQGTDRYALPDDFLRSVALFCEDGSGNRWTLKERSMVGIERDRGLWGSSQGQPSSYHIRTGAKQKTLYTSGDIIIAPTPDGTYTLRLSYIQKPDDLSVDGDIPMLPSQMHEAIAIRAAMMVSRADDDIRRFRELRQLFNEEISVAMTSAHLARNRALIQGELGDVDDLGPARW